MTPKKTPSIDWIIPSPQPLTDDTFPSLINILGQFAESDSLLETNFEFKPLDDGKTSVIVTKKTQITLSEGAKPFLNQGNITNLKLKSADQIRKDLIEENKKSLALSNGRYKNQFEEIQLLGKGGFGKVMKVIDRLEDTTYAVKKVRLHLSMPGDLTQQLKNHKYYREVKALAQSNTQECNFTVRYFNSWIEDLTAEELVEENESLQRFHMRRRLSSIQDESNSDSLTGNSKQKSADYYCSEEELESESSRMLTKTGDLDSRQSLVQLSEADRTFLSINLFIQMEYCDNDLQKFIQERKKPDRQENLRIFS